MTRIKHSFAVLARSLALTALVAPGTHAQAQTDPLPSSNGGPANQTIATFVHETTDQASRRFVPAAERIARLTHDIEKIVVATLTDISVEGFRSELTKWPVEARDPRWQRSCTELSYRPMRELLKYLRANAYTIHVVTGGGQDFVRSCAEATDGVPPEQVVGTALATTYGHDQSGKPFPTRNPACCSTTTTPANRKEST